MWDSNIVWMWTQNNSNTTWWPTGTITGQEKEYMRGLFEVFIVDPNTDTIVLERRVVSTDENKARLKALLESRIILENGVDDYDIIVRRIGDVRAKKEVREVRVVKD